MIEVYFHHQSAHSGTSPRCMRATLIFVRRRLSVPVALLLPSLTFRKGSSPHDRWSQDREADHKAVAQPGHLGGFFSRIVLAAQGASF